MGRVTSKDGTSIAYELSGAGQPVILVGGSLDDGSENGPLASALAEHFAVYNYARRGRGESDSTPPPYDVAREIADLDALIAEAGGGGRSTRGAESSVTAMCMTGSHGQQAEVGHTQDPSVSLEAAGALPSSRCGHPGGVGVARTSLDQPRGVAGAESGLELVPFVDARSWTATGMNPWDTAISINAARGISSSSLPASGATASAVGDVDQMPSP